MFGHQIIEWKEATGVHLYLWCCHLVTYSQPNPAYGNANIKSRKMTYNAIIMTLNHKLQ